MAAFFPEIYAACATAQLAASGNHIRPSLVILRSANPGAIWTRTESKSEPTADSVG